jgi:hypothetical protein
MPLCEGFN